MVPLHFARVSFLIGKVEDPATIVLISGKSGQGLSSTVDKDRIVF